MGYYIPNDKPLSERGAIESGFFAKLSEVPEGKALICEVNNFSFKANGLIYSQRELEDFSEPGDRRPKKWYLMDKEEAHALAGYKE